MSAQTSAQPSATTVFEETFEGDPWNLAGIDALSAVYPDSNSYWLDQNACNGIVLSHADSDAGQAVGGCVAQNVGVLGDLAQLLGDGDAMNHASAAYTFNASGVAGDHEMLTASVTMRDGYYYYGEVDVAVVNCRTGDRLARVNPLIAFIAGGNQIGASIDPCPDVAELPDVPSGETPIGARIVSAEAIRQVGTAETTLELVNLAVGDNGNDAAFDNVRLFEVRPDLHKSFSPAQIVNGEATTLVFTLVNSDDLLAKQGISLTDDMVGLSVAPGAVIGGTCSNVVGTASGTQIDITNADIADGVASCTIEVDVVAAGPGTFENGVDQLSGLAFVTAPNGGDALLQVLPATPVVEDHVSAASAFGDDVEIDVLANASDLEGDIDDTSVAIVDPNYDPSTRTLVVAGEGTWSVDPETGAMTFSPEAGFDGDPTSISYTVMDDAGNTSEPATVAVDYVPNAVDDESLGHTPGDSVIVAVLANDGGVDVASVAIDHPDYDASAGTLVVAGEGAWSVDSATGAITFTPEADFEANPTPISYTAADDDGNSVSAEVVVGYTPEAAADESLGNTIGDEVTIEVLGNDPAANLGPTTVMILDADGSPVVELVVAGEGTWSVDPETGATTFSPEAGFNGDPTSISYTVMDELGQSTPPVQVVVDYVPIAVDDESLGHTPGDSVIVAVLANDGGVDVASVAIDHPDYDASAGTLVVAGEGAWSVDSATGAITFTPEADFEANPTPISYTADDDGNSVSAEVVVGYTPQAAADESLGNTIGDDVTIEVLGNDPAANLDPTTVMILDADGSPVVELVVAGEGTWSVDPLSGAITFSPEAGFNGDPTPIEYVAVDVLGVAIAPQGVVVTYLDPVATTPSVLAFTGVESEQPLLAGLLILAAGAAMVRTGRREEDELDA